MPALLHASRQLRREALGLALAGKRARIDVRSSFRVPPIAHFMRAMRPVGGRKLYAQAGEVAVSAERKAWAEREGLVFKDVEIGVLCYSCERVRVGTFLIRVREGGCEVRGQNGWTRNSEELRRAFAVMEKAEARHGFVGSVFADSLKIAEYLNF